ncbi:RsmE family RNA methyltransferase [candidate division KSB1 bacterium]
MNTHGKIGDVFYTQPENISDKSLVLKGSEFHHCFKVSRKKKGDVIGVIDGEGRHYVCVIDKKGRDYAECRIERIDFKPREPFCDIILIQALIKGDRFDWIVEKATELGVTSIIPVVTEKTVLKPNPAKLKRWKKIALSALKQCGGTVLPEINEILSFPEAVDKVFKNDLKLIAYMSGSSRPVKKILGSQHFSGRPKIVVAIGPEGDFTIAEIDKAKESGFLPVSLGERRLRSETAALFMIAQLINM